MPLRALVPFLVIAQSGLASAIVVRGAEGPKPCCPKPDQPQMPGICPQESGRWRAHHKTGTVLARHALQFCIREPISIAGEWEEQKPWSKPAVHFVRDPLDIVPSAYFYHREAQEPWTLGPISNIDGYDDLMADPEVSQHITPTDTYAGFLQRVPMWLGVRAQIVQSKVKVYQMIEAHDECELNKHLCMKACMSDFMSSSQSFNETWTKILRFHDLDLGLLDCISQFDLNGALRTEHSTSQHTPPDEILAVAAKVRELDSKAFQGKLAKWSGRLACASPVLEATAAASWLKLSKAYA